jgi:hypothetical protein
MLALPDDRGGIVIAWETCAAASPCDEETLFARRFDASTGWSPAVVLGSSADYEDIPPSFSPSPKATCLDLASAVGRDGPGSRCLAACRCDAGCRTSAPRPLGMTRLRGAPAQSLEGLGVDALVGRRLVGRSPLELAELDRRPISVGTKSKRRFHEPSWFSNPTPMRVQ